MTSPDPWKRAEARQAFVASIPALGVIAVDLVGACLSRDADAVTLWARRHALDVPWCLARLRAVQAQLLDHAIASVDDARAFQPFIWYTFDLDDPQDEAHHVALRARRLLTRDLAAWDGNPATPEGQDALRRVGECLPIAADPTQETRSQFLDYAARHYDARLRALAEAGVQVARDNPECGAHAVWTLRYHVGGESYKQIGEAVARRYQSVAEAVQRFASVIELPLRSPRRPQHRIGE